MKNLKGLNWLNLKPENGSLNAYNNDETLFQIPFKQIDGTTIMNKNDLQIQLPYDENNKQNDNLCEVRFYFPPQQAPQDQDSQQAEEQKNKNNEAAEEIKNLILSQIKQGDRSIESIITFEEIPLLVPRGKYTCDFYDQYLSFHGQTHNYRIEYSNIERAFLLPRPDEVHMILTRKYCSVFIQVYPFITIQMKKDIQNTFKLRIKEEQKQIFNENLQEQYSGAVYDVLTKMMKLIVQTNIIIPGNFKSSNSQSGIRCSYKAQDGFLFPLQKSLIFVTKPVLYIRFDDISLAVFQRIGPASRLFDLEFRRKSTNQSLIFTSIDKNEFPIIKDYLTTKGVSVELEDENKKIQRQIDDIESDIDVSDDSRSVFCLIQQKGEKKKGKGMELEDEDDESDESYKADDGDDSSSSRSSDIDDEKDI